MASIFRTLRALRWGIWPQSWYREETSAKSPTFRRLLPAQGGVMAATAIQTMMVGNPSANTAAMLFRLAARGWGARHADTLTEAKEVMATFRIAVVLAAENLPDGRGYDLGATVSKQSGYLYVGVPLSETLWLPVIERGARVLGQRALNTNVFENEVEFALGLVGGEARVAGHRSEEARGETSRGVASMKRRGAEAA